MRIALIRPRIAVPIRWRIAAVSTVAAGILLGGAGLLFLTTLRTGLERSVDVSLRATATSLAGQLTSTGTPRSGATFTVGNDSYGQVISATGTVITATPQRLPAPLLTTHQIATVISGRTFDVRLAHESRRELPKGLRVFAEPLSSGQVIAVAVSRDVIDEAVERAGKQLLVLGAIALVAAGLGSWALAGTALRPVERLRRQAAELEAHDLGAELQVPHTGDEVQRLAVTLNALLARLQGAIDRERQFVADAGHELRTPLTVLRGELELARRPGRSQQDLRETVEIAADETERLIALAENLLTLARQDGAVDPLEQRFELMSVLRSVAERFSSDAKVRMDVSGPDELPVRGDEESIRRVIVNLVANARRYAERVVTVAVITDASQVRIAVEDDGPGFSEEFLPHAFERFARDDAPRTRSADTPGGSGLGLSIVHAIAVAHGGGVSARNRPGHGALVTMTWPGRVDPQHNGTVD